MKFPLAPEIKRAVVEQAERGTFGYCVSADRLDEAVRSWMLRRHDWRVEPEWMFRSYGLVSAIGYGVKAMTEPGDGVLVFFPSYGPFPRAVTDNGRQLVSSELLLEDGRFVMDYDDVEQKLSRPEVRALILCNPHNPTGRVWTYGELEKLGVLCLKHGVKVISDDIHFDIVYAPHRHTVFAAIAPELADITLTLTAPSKTFNIAGMTISNSFVSNPALREKYAAVLRRDMGGYFNAFGLAANLAAYEEGESWLEEALSVLGGNCEYLRTFLAERVPGFSTLRQEGTYLCWMDCSGSGLEGEELNAFLAGAGFLSQRGTDFGVGFTRRHRVNVACPREYLEAALLRLERAVAGCGG